MKVIPILFAVLLVGGCCKGMTDSQRAEFNRCKNVSADHYQECAR